MIYSILRPLALTALYLLALAGLTVLVEPLGAFVVAFALLSAAYFIGLTVRPPGDA